MKNSYKLLLLVSGYLFIVIYHQEALTKLKNVDIYSRTKFIACQSYFILKGLVILNAAKIDSYIDHE